MLFRSEAERLKGSPLTEEEQAKLEERAAYARFWLSTYAPDEFRYALQSDMPSVDLSDTQKKALAALASFLDEAPRTGDDIHQRLHELKTEIPIAPKELFVALYRIFFNRDSGPKAGWFLAGLDRGFTIRRLQEAAQ